LDRTSSNLLEVEDVWVRHGDVAAVRGVSLSVAPGEIVGLIGANGAGKTSLVNGLMGGIPVKQGRMSLAGESLLKVPPHERSRRGMGLVPEGRQVFSSMSVFENVRVGAKARGITSVDVLNERWATCTSLFPRLAERRDQKAGTLSGGEQQMVAIARALMGEPRLLILDEPSAGLAPKLVAEVFKVIGALRESFRGVLLVEQNAAQTLGVADRLYVMELGRIVAAGTPDELRQQGDMFERYVGGV
jgi:branched-chain amino acid transport system ATP-binding protein